MSNSSIRPIDRTLSDTITLSSSGPGSDGNEGILHTKIQHYWSPTIEWFSVICRTLIWVAGLIPLQRCSWCILLPQPTEIGSISLKLTLFKEGPVLFIL